MWADSQENAKILFNLKFNLHGCIEMKRLAILLAVFLSACVSIPSPNLQVQVKASNTLNVDATLASLPVRIKIYQLSDDTAFKEATFRALWKSDASTLGASLLAKKEMTINPGQTYQFKFKRQEQAEFFGVVGIFRHHRQGWKEIKPLSGFVRSFLIPIQIEVKNYSVEVH